MSKDEGNIVRVSCRRCHGDSDGLCFDGKVAYVGVTKAISGDVTPHRVPLTMDKEKARRFDDPDEAAKYGEHMAALHPFWEYQIEWEEGETDEEDTVADSRIKDLEEENEHLHEQVQEKQYCIENLLQEKRQLRQKVNSAKQRCEIQKDKCKERGEALEAIADALGTHWEPGCSVDGVIAAAEKATQNAEGE